MKFTTFRELAAPWEHYVFQAMVLFWWGDSKIKLFIPVQKYFLNFLRRFFCEAFFLWKEIEKQLLDFLKK